MLQVQAIITETFGVKLRIDVECRTQVRKVGAHKT
jgi:hypothetical protein